MVQYALYSCPFGYIKIGCTDCGITEIRIVQQKDSQDHPSLLSDQAAAQLRQYFSGSLKSFDLPVMWEGTPFQEAVWNALRDIPYGETRTYGQIAAAIGRPKAARAVGMACNRNPIWIIIPCHRVIGSSGKLTGYEGGVHMKQTLLQLEQENR